MINIFSLETTQPHRVGLKTRNLACMGGLLIALLAMTVGCGRHKAGELGKISKFTIPTGPVQLKQHWQAGERVQKTFGLNMTSDITVPNRPQPIKQITSVDEGWTVNILKDNPDGSHDGEMELNTIRMKLEQNGKTLIDYDSENKSATPDKNPDIVAVQKALADVAGTKLQFTIDVTNHVDNIIGAEELRNRLAAKGGNNSGMSSMFNDAYLRQMIGATESLPDKPVQPGDTWPVHLQISLGDMGNIATDYDFNLAKWETHGQRLCGRLEFQGTLKGTPNAGAKNSGLSMLLQDGTTSGVSWFDPELGLVVEANLNQDLTMLMSMPVNVRGKSMTLNMTNLMHQVITVKLNSVNIPSSSPASN